MRVTGGGRERSGWLAAGVPSTQCAEWAGHSVGVLHQIYAKVIGGLEAAAHRRIEEALGWEPETREQIGNDQPDSAGPDWTEPGKSRSTLGASSQVKWPGRSWFGRVPPVRFERTLDGF